MLGYILELRTQPHGTLQRPTACFRLCIIPVAKAYPLCLRAISVSADSSKYPEI